MQQANPQQKAHFKVFVDEHNPDESATIEEQWQTNRKQQRNTKLTRVLIIGAVVIGLIFALLLNTFLSHESQHTVLDNSDPDYTYIQTTFPHLKVLVSKHSDAYEAKVVRAIGIHQAQLISWIQGNVTPDMQVLLIPDQFSGVNLLGMALGYYLKSSQKGHLDILISLQSYLEMTNKNIKLMEEDHNFTMPVSILKTKQKISSHYDLIVIEDTQFALAREQSLAAERVLHLEMRDSTNQVEVFPDGRLDEWKKYQLVGGVANDEIRQLGKQTAYALKEYVKTELKKTTAFLYQKQAGISLNLCPESQVGLPESMRNLVEFFRNKTIASLYYGLADDQTLNIIRDLNNTQTLIEGELNNLQSGVEAVATSKYNYFVMAFQAALKLSTQPAGSLLVWVADQSQASQVKDKFPGSNVQVLSALNNKGCYYPPRLLEADSSFNGGYFLVIVNASAQS